MNEGEKIIATTKLGTVMFGEIVIDCFGHKSFQPNNSNWCIDLKCFKSIEEQK